MQRYLFLGVLALSACHRAAPPPSRVLHVRVAADQTFRQRANWKDLAASRIKALSHIYEIDFDIRMELAGSAEWAPEGTTEEDRRRSLLGVQSDGNWLFLGFTAPDPTATEPGLVVPFDNRVLVFDDTARSEAENVNRLAHLVGHVFGAWHSRDEKSIMYLPPGTQFDTASLAAVRTVRTFDTRSGARALGSEKEAELNKLWSESKSEPATNPLYQYFASSGYELMSMGLLQQAVEPLSRAVNFGPREVRTRYGLATSYMLMRNYHAAAAEFRRITELDPQSAAALNNLARALLESGQADGALATLRKAVMIAPENAALHANMGMTLARIHGQLDEGIEVLRTAQRLNPNDQNIKAALDAAVAAKARGRN